MFHVKHFVGVIMCEIFKYYSSCNNNMQAFVAVDKFAHKYLSVLLKAQTNNVNMW